MHNKHARRTPEEGKARAVVDRTKPTPGRKTLQLIDVSQFSVFDATKPKVRRPSLVLPARKSTSPFIVPVPQPLHRPLTMYQYMKGT